MTDVSAKQAYLELPSKFASWFSSCSLSWVTFKPILNFRLVSLWGKEEKKKRIYKSKSFHSTTEFFWMLRSIKQDQYCMENCLCSFASLCFLMHDELLLSVLSIKGYERWIEFLPRQWNQRRTKQRKADIDYWNSEILH